MNDYKTLVEFDNNSMSKQVKNTDHFTHTCKICGKSHGTLRYLILDGYGCYICDTCRIRLTVLSNMSIDSRS